jgi:hypothetical protein
MFGFMTKSRGLPAKIGQLYINGAGEWGRGEGVGGGGLTSSLTSSRRSEQSGGTFLLKMFSMVHPQLRLGGTDTDTDADTDADTDTGEVRRVRQASNVHGTYPY